MVTDTAALHYHFHSNSFTVTLTLPPFSVSVTAIPTLLLPQSFTVIHQAEVTHLSHVTTTAASVFLSLHNSNLSGYDWHPYSDLRDYYDTGSIRQMR